MPDSIVVSSNRHIEFIIIPLCREQAVWCDIVEVDAPITIGGFIVSQ